MKRTAYDMIKKISSIFAFFAVVIALSSCASTKRLEPQTQEGVFKEAMEKFNNEDYLEARSLFEVIKLQYPAGQYADDAQYYLAEIYYKRGEFILAAFNFNYLRRLYPGSEYTKRALYKCAMAYYEVSPEYDRDQEDTRKAISAFQEYQYLYPGDSVYVKAGDYITELRDKLGHREFFTAQLYEKLQAPLSSLVYYNIVISDYPDTKYFEDSYLGKVKVQVEMNRAEEARGTLDAYKKAVPNGKYTAKMIELIEKKPQ